MGIESFSDRQFDFSRYDVGGEGAIRGDKKLTGEEIEKARLDGWDIKKGSFLLN